MPWRHRWNLIRKRAYCSLFIVLLSLDVRCLCQTQTGTQDGAEAHLREAHRLLGENRPAAAIPELRVAVALAPSNLDARGNLGVLLFFQGNYAEAMPHLREVLRLKPDLWKLQALLGMAERRTGDTIAARADLENAFPQVREAKVRIEAGLELVQLYTATEDLEKASQTIGVLRGFAPENPQVLYAAYRIHSDLAREAILSLSVLAPKSALMYQVMAHEAARRGDSSEAIRAYRKAIELDPRVPGLHFELAEMLHSLPKAEQTTAQAKAEYETALAQDPFDVKAALRLAEMAEGNGDQSKAYQLYTQAVKLQPDNPEACYELGKMQAEAGHNQEAETLLEHAAQIDPTNATIHFRLSTVYQRLGRSEDARREVEQYRKYKTLKDTLRDTYKELHLNPGEADKDRDDSNQ